jgi:hypothetical protein
MMVVSREKWKIPTLLLPPKVNLPPREKLPIIVFAE